MESNLLPALAIGGGLLAIMVILVLTYRLPCHMQLEATQKKHVEQLRLADEDCEKKLLAADKLSSESIASLKADYEAKLNIRMSALAQKKATAMAAKGEELVSKDETIKSQSVEISQLEKKLNVEQSHSEEIRRVSVKLQAELSDCASEISVLQAERRRDSVVAVETAELVNQHHNKVATLHLELSLLRQAHEGKLQNVRQQHESRSKIRALGLMRACLRDLEQATGVVSVEDRMAWERRVGEWRGQIRQLEKEVAECEGRARY